MNQIEELKASLEDRLKPNEIELLDEFCLLMGMSSSTVMYGSMLLDSVAADDKIFLTFNPFRTVFIKTFYQKAKEDESLYIDKWINLFYSLQRGFIIYQLEKIKDKKKLLEFKERLEEAKYMFKNPFVDDDFMYEVDEIISML
jgi:hypothetical protein